MKKCFNSLQRVIDLKPKNVIPSHGIIIGGTHKVEETLKHRQMRENQIKELMSKNATMDEMIKSIYPELEERLIKYARKTIEAHLEKINLEKVPGTF